MYGVGSTHLRKHFQSTYCVLGTGPEAFFTHRKQSPTAQDSTASAGRSWRIKKEKENPRKDACENRFPGPVHTFSCV